MPRGTPGPLPERADIAVIGTGFAGLTASRLLSRNGARTVTLEARSIAWGASSRNGGMVLTGLKLGADTLAARYGMEKTRQLYRASLESINCVERIVREENIDCDFSRCGHLEVAAKPAHFAAYARQAEVIAREFGHSVRIVPSKELASEIGSEKYFGGMVDETSAGVNPAQYAAGLARSAMARGAQIYEACPVKSLTRASENGSPGFRILTPGGTLFAKEVLAATGAYTTGAFPALQKRIIPVGSYIIATAPLPGGLAAQLSPRRRMIYDSKHFLHYFRLTADNRMLFGGRAAFFPESPDTVRRSAEILQRDMLEIFPQLREFPVEYVWGGTLDFCFDTMPHAGTLDGIHYCAGFAGHGVAMATFLGETVAKQILGGAPNPLSEFEIPGAPFGLYNGTPWFLPFAGAYYKVLDWIN